MARRSHARLLALSVSLLAVACASRPEARSRSLAPPPAASVAAAASSPSPAPEPAVSPEPAVAPELARPSAPPIDRSRPPPDRVLEQATRVLTSMTATTYSHADRIDEESGRYDLDCSGFATHLLRHAAPEPLESVPRDPGERRPRAWQFYTAFARAQDRAKAPAGWVGVLRMADALPGDLVAWRKDKIPKKGNTGHIVVVAEPPVVEKNGDVRVVVIDSTGLAHGNDSRAKGATGIGRGTMWFRVDAKGAPVAYRWASPSGELKAVAIAIGRPVDPPDVAPDAAMAAHAAP